MSGDVAPGPGWRIDVFLYMSRIPGGPRGMLFLAWHGGETRVRYADARERDVTPWHGRWEVSPEDSHKLSVLVKACSEKYRPAKCKSSECCCWWWWGYYWGCLDMLCLERQGAESGWGFGGSVRLLRLLGVL